MDIMHARVMGVSYQGGALEGPLQRLKEGK